ncbi:hypothetical protein Efla_001911 [Eimeria flavescens]
MDPFAVFRWLGACAEPSIEEAQPAWWVELQRAEALQAAAAAKQHMLHSSAADCIDSNEKKRAAAAAPQADAALVEPRCYENEAELVISRKLHAAGQQQTRRAEKQEAQASWTLADIDDLEEMRRRLLFAVPSSASSSVFDLRTSDLRCNSLSSSDSESVFFSFQNSASELERPTNSFEG